MAEQINPNANLPADLDAKKKRFLEDMETGLVVIKDLDKYNFLGIPDEWHKDIALKLITLGKGALVAENLSRFAELNQTVAVALVKAGFGLEVMNNMDYFDGLDDNIVAMAMMLVGQGGFVRLNQELFPGLTEETLEKINKRSYQPTPEDRESVFGEDPEKEALRVFCCRPEQIAHQKSEINNETKVYIDALYPGIFNDLRGVEHIYTVYPEGKLFQKRITIGAKTVRELEDEFKEKGYHISNYAGEMIHKCRPSEKVKNLDLVALSVKDLGFPIEATRQKIYDKAQELGLAIVPPEVGLHLRLQYEDQPVDETLIVGSEAIQHSSGNPHLFKVNHGDNGFWLGRSYGASGANWSKHDRWVFSRPSAPEKK